MWPGETCGKLRNVVPDLRSAQWDKSTAARPVQGTWAGEACPAAFQEDRIETTQGLTLISIPASKPAVGRPRNSLENEQHVTLWEQRVGKVLQQRTWRQDLSYYQE